MIHHTSPCFVFGLFKGFDLGQDWEKYGVWAAWIQKTFYNNYITWKVKIHWKFSTYGVYSSFMVF